MASTLLVHAPAKINLTLEVTARRADGYHLLRSVMQTVSLWDDITLALRQQPGIALSCNLPELHCGEDNLAHRAARAFFAHTGLPPVGLALHIEKRIPLQKGLAGGSADAAGVLVGLNHLLQANLTTAQLCEIGLTLGADVPFCLHGGTVLAQGVGEVFTPLPPLPDCCILLTAPQGGMSTAESFRRYDAQPGLALPPDVQAVARALAGGNLQALGASLGNVLQPHCTEPLVESLINRVAASGALGAAMSGSGTAVFGIYTDIAAAQQTAAALAAEGLFAVLCRPQQQGAHLAEHCNCCV